MIIKRLTDEQSAELRTAFRAACAAEDPETEIDKFYEKYANLYELSVDDLRFFGDVDRKRQAAENSAPKRRLSKKQEQGQKFRQQQEQNGAQKLRQQQLNPPQKNKKRARKQEQRRREQEEKQKRLRLPEGVSVAEYYGHSTYCPVCLWNFGQILMPPHGPAPHGCKGAGKFGVTRYTIAQQAGAVDMAKAESGSSVHAVGGGLPTLGNRHR
jgi:ATPase subunit of ABC transporter with duplicated ATPase domains